MTGVAAIGTGALGGGLIGAGAGGAFGGALAWGQAGVDWTLWLQHTYQGAMLGAVFGATFQGQVAAVAVNAPRFLATWYGGILTYGTAGAIGDWWSQMTALAYGWQNSYSPLQTLASASGAAALGAALRGGAALWTRFRATPKPTLAPRANGGFSGHRGFELDNHPLQPVRNSPVTIGQRQFSGHALDQMQNRGIPPSVVENTIQHGVPFPGNRPGTQGFYDPVNNTSVIINSNNGTVVTVRYGRGG